MEEDVLPGRTENPPGLQTLIAGFGHPCLKYSDIVLENILILLLDFQKAFDSVKHQLILKALDFIGFGEHLKKKNYSFCMPLGIAQLRYHGTTERFRNGTGNLTRFPRVPIFVLSFYTNFNTVTLLK